MYTSNDREAESFAAYMQRYLQAQTTRMKQTKTITLIALLWGCEYQPKPVEKSDNGPLVDHTNKGQTDKFKTHEKLIECNTQYVMEDGEEASGYHEDYENFIKDYFQERQKGDTLIISTLIEVNACGETIGDIEYLGDTLYLKSRQIADEVCASTMFETFTYKIHNPDK